MGCRSAQRGHAALQAIREAVPGAKLQLCVVDVADPASIRKAASSLRAR